MKLKHEGFETDLATNGAEAIEKLKIEEYSMVLLDLIMPVIDGFGVLEEIRSRKLKTPVIILSNLGQDEDRAKAKELGAVDYFVKSNTPIADIISRVKDVIH
jgi:DNA-binding response OmpR family regulator